MPDSIQESSTLTEILNRLKTMEAKAGNFEVNVDKRFSAMEVKADNLKCKEDLSPPLQTAKRFVLKCEKVLEQQRSSIKHCRIRPKQALPKLFVY